MQCEHCDLPTQYYTYDKKDLTANEWQQVLDRIIPVIKPKIVSIAAREPLFDRESMEKTKCILETARTHNIRCGFVTNSLHINEFFQGLNDTFRFDYIDLSMEGLLEKDQASRGPNHFGLVQKFLQTIPYQRHVDSLFVSSTMTALNSSEAHFREFSSWIVDNIEHPQLALLLLYYNHNVNSKLVLSKDDIKRIIDQAVSVSSQYDDIFLEVFPGSVPNLHELIEDNILPGAGQVFRDEDGVLCGHVANNLFIRYVTPMDLIRYHLRISPEGMILTPNGIEQPDYAQGNLGDIVNEDFSIIQNRIEDSLIEQKNKIHQECIDKSCFEVCGGGNYRCSQLINK